MPSSSSDGHPGPHIRATVLPSGMAVAQAARVIGVGRPALSNLLNGKAALSPDMAARMERAFGVNSLELLDMQAAYDAALAKGKGAAASARTHVVPFLQFKANDIEDWVRSSLTPRSRLSVLLRTLVHSTGSRITAADFPGNDDSERPGWDGFVDAEEATPWIPVGKSGWEFGVNADPKAKADKDYAKSVKRLSPEEQAEITFVFVTPRRWPGKAAWMMARRAEKRWKDVRVYDASDLEQWLEQSIPAQAWFAHERGVPSQGVLSLDACWRQWVADSDPPLAETLFDEAVAEAEAVVGAKLLKSTAETVVITADSRDEGLAFLHCLLAPSRPELAALRDRVVVFSQPGALTRLASKTANFIPVVSSHAVEKELASHRVSLHAIVVYARNATNAEPDVRLEPLSYMAFDKALQAMGYGREEFVRLGRESGRSLTVLRRRLSGLEAVRTPGWAADPGLARSLIPFLFAGAWNSSGSADRIVLSSLAEDAEYKDLESRLASLLQLDDAPVWSIGTYRGLISKIDALFAINRSLTRADLGRFFEVAWLVLSEDDPSLDLPEKDRWMAGWRGKTREITAPLRDGIGETLVLLAVYGSGLFRERLGFDPSNEARRLVRRLLSPVTARTLEAHSDDLPMYAEAAPDEFLDILEADLASPEPEAVKLMRPADSGAFGRCPRTGLLWALENTAWAPERLVRTVGVLARLAEPVIDDNWANKPSASLSSVFRCWMPQTAASLEQRIAALEYLVEHHPKIAWPVCIKQLDIRSTIGGYSHRPRWRPDARGHGEPITIGEAHSFRLRAFDLALGWKAHTGDTLGDLTDVLVGLDETLQTRIWDVIDCWSGAASCEDRAWLREKVRANANRKEVRRRKLGEVPAIQLIERARRAYDRLKPEDPVLEHAWLFRTHWVAESADELLDENPDYQRREERIAARRLEALRDVMGEGGLDAVMRLAGMGDAAADVGCLLPRLFATTHQQIDAVRKLLAADPLPGSPVCRALISGFFGSLPEDHLVQALRTLTAQRDREETVSLLVLTPFQQRTWHLAAALGGDVEKAYWREVRPGWWRRPEEDVSFVIEQLLAAGRPQVAFRFAEFQLEQVQPEQLFRLLKALATNPGGTREAEAEPRYQFDGYRINEAFKLLNQSGQIAVPDMAGLEFQYIQILDDKAGIPNLEQQIDVHPELFVQAIAFVYGRHDDAEDPPPFRVDDPEIAVQRGNAAYRLLDKLSRLPGRNRQGGIEPERLLSWIGQVRASCAQLSRADACDSQVGQLLSRAPVGNDGVWPCEPVREVIERIAAGRVAPDGLAQGIKTGLYNSRGVHSRGDGGGPERRLAAKYGAWARALEFRHPRTTRILREMEGIYENEAAREDADAGIRRRLHRY